MCYAINNTVKALYKQFAQLTNFANALCANSMFAIAMCANSICAKCDYFVQSEGRYVPVGVGNRRKIKTSY